LDSFKGQSIEKNMFLYLVDEYTGKPVVTKGGAYPIHINVRSEKAKNFLPAMAVGLKAMALTNKALGLIAMIYPVAPQIPPELIKKMETVIKDSKPVVIEEALNDTSDARDGVSGGVR
jgi:hypothetical protein